MPTTKPSITLIAAMAHNRIIGKNNQMPWHLPADLAHFKKMTLGKPVIMGRKTYESIGRPLPGRKNIVVTRNPGFAAAGITSVSDLEKAITAAGDVAEVVIMGGGNIYQQMLEKADRLYLTYIDVCIAGDTQFPDYEHLTWKQTATEIHPADEKNNYSMTFVTLERE
jgi:dihydrofolate reductase